MSEQLKASIVRFQDAGGTIVGAGFLVSEKTLLTCAHVVAQALGVSEDAPDVPIGEVQLDFPLVAPGNTLGAKLSDWRPAYPSTAIREDVAALILIGDPPDGSCSARLTRADALWGHRFRAFGFPAGYDTGVWASGVIRDQQADGWVQIEDVKQTGYFVEPGFSGAPVWDEEVNGIVGMIVAAERRTHVKAAFVFPATQLVKVLPNLADQTRHPTRLIEQRYREEIAKIWCRPRLPEAFTSGLDLSRLTIASLFVRLRVRSRRSPTKLAEPPSEITDRLTPRQRRQLTEITAERSGLDSLGPLDPGLRDRIEEWLAGLTSSEPLDLAQALLRNRKLAVSGPGGSGKTTLMRWLARVCAEDRQADPVALGPAFSRRLLPIVIDLREFASWLHRRDADSKRPPRRDLLALYIAERPEHDPACYQMLIAAIDRGEAIVLADGLDEILDRRLRERMTAFLQGFIGDEAGQRCFVVVTSRPHACPPGLLGDEIDYVELLPFRLKDVRAYLVSHWYPAAYGPALATEAEALATEVAETPALARLAVNPLLCTLLAVNYRAGLRPLPKRRIDVFEKCCNLLIHRWDEGRAIPWPQGRAEEIKLSLAARLAFAALAESPDLNLAENRARSLATEYLRNNALDCSEDEAGRAAEALLRAIRERAGLIEARGDGSYQFLIRPFLDYLAGRHIAAIAAKEGEEAILDVIMPHVFDGEWRESIVMAAAHMARTADTFPRLARVLRRILEVTRLYRWPRGRIGIRRLPRAGRDRWLESSLLRLENLTAGMIGEAVGRHTNAINQLRAISKTITRRCRVCLLNGDDFVSRVAAEILGRLVLVEPEAEEVLVEALRRGRRSTRAVVARELGRPGISLESVHALANAAGEKDTAVRKAAIEAIAVAGRFPPPVISVLISAARDEKAEIRSLAITALGKAGDLLDELTELLLTYLDAHNAYGLNFQPPLVCCAAAKALSSAGPMTPNLVDTLVRALNAGDDKIRKAAVASLGHLALSSTSVMEALLRALEDKDWWVRCEIVRALGIASGSSKTALDAVLAATHDKVSNVRRNAIEVLRDLGIREKSAVDVLITAVSDENFWVSSMAVLALSGMGLISEDLKGRLIFERRQVYAREPGNAAFLGLTGLVPPESSEVIAEALVRLVQGKGYWRNAAM